MEKEGIRIYYRKERGMEEAVDNKLEETAQESPTPSGDVVLGDITTKEPAQAHQENSPDVNMARIREEKAEALREKARLEAQLKEMQDKAQQPTYGDEDFVEGKHLKKEMEGLRRQMNEYKSEQAQVADHSRLKQQYADFDSVVSAENVDRLKSLDPDTTDLIVSSSASYYAKGVAAYRRIKELDLEDKHEKGRARTQENASKPRTMNSVSPQQGDSPLSMANAFSDGLTPDLKRQLWKEMRDASNKS